jgi:hypothetical protein
MEVKKEILEHEIELSESRKGKIIWNKLPKIGGRGARFGGHMPMWQSCRNVERKKERRDKCKQN